MVTLRQALQSARLTLGELPHSDPELEAALLLCHLLGKPRSHLFAWPEATLTADMQQAYATLIKRRRNGAPIAYITGEREFWSLTLRVTPDTLIPRPETELLVERSLHHLRQRPDPLVADLGAGSGAIALALASERPDARIHAGDRSAEALAVAGENAARLGFTQVSLFRGNWCEALPTENRYDLIACNPPYIETGDPHLSRGDLPNEPASALVSGSDGLADIRVIIQQAGGRLKKGGWLLLEHGYRQAPKVQQLLRAAGLSDISTHRDLSGHPRLTESRLAEYY
ncbi:MAG: peptide chain release factor N(5)-glutamine methyltransferase [Candidatus Thiodiazotropha sp. (ex Epidulcina cf. delphinae)]|nr:peptide chain release factor N(5)-glutamine methyltransferase [Candidatus Thiodiazotropha sp. (ex Epidulcina cf. delphinae)]